MRITYIKDGKLVIGWIPNHTRMYEGEEDYKAKRYDPEEDRWLYSEEPDFEPTVEKKPNLQPHTFTSGLVKGVCLECLPLRRHASHSIHTKRN